MQSDNMSINLSTGDVTEYYLVAEITVLNVQSYPTVGGTWEAEFDVIGTADLTVTTIDGGTLFVWMA